MKKFIIIVIVFFNITGYSQNAPDIKVSDIFGNVINSYDLQSQGKFIFIDFFSNGCGTCQTIVPYIDSAYKYFGCNCDDVFFVGINIFQGSDNQSVFDFAIEFGAEIPLVSGQKGGAIVADAFGVNYTPFFALISPQNQILVFDNFPILNTQSIIDSLSKYNINQNICKGSDFIYFEAIKDSTSYIAEINKTTKEILLYLPDNYDISNVQSFFIASSNSKVFFEQNEVLSDTNYFNLLDSTRNFRVVAEDSTFNDWTILIETSTVIFDEIFDKSFFVDDNNFLHFENIEEIRNYKIYNLSGNYISGSFLVQEIQNLGILQNGIYILSIELKDGRMINKKIIIK